MFKVICLAWYVTVLIGKINGISHVYASNAIDTHSYFDAGYNWGYRSGYMAGIALWAIGIVLMSIKLIKGEPAFSFIKR